MGIGDVGDWSFAAAMMSSVVGWLCKLNVVLGALTI